MATTTSTRRAGAAHSRHAVGRTRTARSQVTGPSLLFVDERGRVRRLALRAARELTFANFHPVREPRNSFHSPTRMSRSFVATSSRQVTCRSRLAERNLLVMDFDPAVADVCAEPFALHPDADSPEGFVPDFLVRGRRGQLRVVDVASEHQQRLPSSRARIGQMQRACAQLGWEYALMGEPDRTFMANLSAITPGRREVPHIERYAPALLAAAHERVSIGQLLRAVEGPDALLRPVIDQLLWQRRLHANLRMRLDDDTRVRAVR